VSKFDVAYIERKSWRILKTIK